MSARRVAELELELACPKCGSAILVPASKLLDPLPQETQPEYAARMRREWKRETSRPRRRGPSRQSEQTDDDVRDLLAQY